MLFRSPADRDEIAGFGPKLTPVVEQASNYSARELLSVPAVLRRLRADLFHAPHYVVSPITPRPYVVTIHDCIHLMFPQYLPGRLAYVYAKGSMWSATRKADRILTVSEASNEPRSYSVLTIGVDRAISPAAAARLRATT